ncbi:MAG: Spx/MgsR family RNA polymerase-binding regulatory protein [Gammaproteobacteria bacterium]|nr:Spx/MgsR family RNA polymerase-binding regulatory protein [Gammaproteobacteria bacterium]
MTQVQMHGISNCDTIKKAKKWLVDASIEFDFRDYKKQPPSRNELQQWIGHVGWETLLNKRGTTWRKLSTAQQDAVNEDTVCALLEEYPSMIKRPLLVMQPHQAKQNDQQIQAFVGFNAEQYTTIFKL